MDIPVIIIMISDMTAMNLIKEVFLMEIRRRAILMCGKCFERMEIDEMKARNIPGA